MFIKIMSVLALGVLASGCSSTDEVAKMKVMGGAFEKGLHSGYIRLADMEFDEADTTDGNAFTDRARMAAMGKPTGIEALSARNLKKKHSKQLKPARSRLAAAFSQGGARKAPKLAAKAQTSFECWMQEAEEDMQKKHIAACRNNFYGAMALLEGALYTPTPVAKAPVMMPRKMMKKGPPKTREFTIYFGFDSAKVINAGPLIAVRAASFAKEHKGSAVYVTSHTDRAGANKYNAKLAKTRAAAVSQLLVGAGLKKKSLGVLVQGENSPAVRSGNGKKEALNRRVVISVIY